MTDEVLVLLYGAVVGVLRRDDAREDPSFTYLPEYVRDGTLHCRHGYRSQRLRTRPRGSSRFLLAEPLTAREPRD